MLFELRSGKFGSVDSPDEFGMAIFEAIENAARDMGDTPAIEGRRPDYYVTFLMWGEDFWAENLGAPTLVLWRNVPLPTEEGPPNVLPPHMLLEVEVAVASIAPTADAFVEFRKGLESIQVPPIELRLEVETFVSLWMHHADQLGLDPDDRRIGDALATMLTSRQMSQPSITATVSEMKARYSFASRGRVYFSGRDEDFRMSTNIAEQFA